ncbi:hypothetical protein JZY91_02695 [Corynebacterium sp. CNCTC7651]|uniref:S1 family peptidase n=1 Tax=Corynebacterium sp. CNCTC7651 TaxID=2815361 RepID=UPI001F217BE7|nr:S1 family peptidase [Corynebacterium sp. CNCTC7651]UIZ92698.1 hypothetical protein JZY91_02695 [Corynebacterium sp. CNCTC7651]
MPQPTRDLGDVFHSSSDLQWLQRPGMVFPGARYTTYGPDGKAKGNCSFGWMLQDPQTRTYYNATAGHCGVVGDRVYIQKNDGTMVFAGRFVESTGKPKTPDALDLAIISLEGSQARISSSLPTKYLKIIPAKPVTKVMRSAELEQTQPFICRLGYRTGLSCGYYLRPVNRDVFLHISPADNGDSGGPIWVCGATAEDCRTGRSDWYAAGIESYIHPYRYGENGAATVDVVTAYAKSKGLRLVYPQAVKQAG